MVDEAGYQKTRLRIKVLNYKTYVRAQQGRSHGQAPEPELPFERITNPDAVECMAHDTFRRNMENIARLEYHSGLRTTTETEEAEHLYTSYAATLETGALHQGPKTWRGSLRA